MADNLPFDPLLYRKGELIFRAINNRFRQQILSFINKQGSITVGEIYKNLKLDQSSTSQHLRILRDVGYVTTTRNGRQILYSINHKHIEEMNKIITKLIKKKH